MASPQWYNENRNRSYPFVQETVGLRGPRGGPLPMRQLPPAWIVEARFVMGCESGYDDAQDTVYLRRVWREGSTIFFAFSSQSAALWGHDLIFQREIGGHGYELSYSDGDFPEDSHAPWLQACEQPLWSGYLVTWDMANVAYHLADGDEILANPGDAIVEPALIQNLSDGLLGSVNLANDDRTRVTAPAGCDQPSWPYPTGIIFLAARCLQGDLRWKAGYNCVITQDDSTNSITIAALQGGGEGEPATEVPLFDSEQAPTGSTNTLLEGGAQCPETLRAINGVGGPLYAITAGTGVSIIPDPTHNRLVIDVGLQDMVTCFGDQSIISEHV